MAEKMAAQARLQQQMLQPASSFSGGVGGVGGGGGGGGGGSVDASAVTEKVDNIVSKMDRIEKMLLSLEKHHGDDHKKMAPKHLEEPTSAAGGVKAEGSTASYRDKSEPSAGNALVVVPDDELKITNRAKITYGLQVASILGRPDIAIKVASQLPPSTAVGNAFSNSYLFDPAQAVLFIHEKRVDSGGEFGLMVTHAVSHIKTGRSAPDRPDTDPAFLSEFYRNLKIVSQDLYKKTPRESNFSAVGGSGTEDNRKSRNSLMTKKSMLRLPSLNTSEPSTSQGSDAAPANYFTPDAMAERMKLYAKFGTK